MKYLGFYFVFFIISALSVQAQTEPVLNAGDTAIYMDFRVKGITCANDINTLTERVKAIPGVIKFETLKQGAISKFSLGVLINKVKPSVVIDTIQNTAGCKNPADRPYKIVE